MGERTIPGNQHKWSVFRDFSPGGRCACIVPGGVLFGVSSSTRSWSTLSDNGMMKDLSVLREQLFTDHDGIVEVFTDLTLWAGIKGVIDRINANAAA